MDGVVGLEPTNDRIKICWLTGLPIPHHGSPNVMHSRVVNQVKDVRYLQFFSTMLRGVN